MYSPSAGKRCLAIRPPREPKGRSSLMRLFCERRRSAGAQGTLIAATAVGEIAQRIDEGGISWAGRAFDETDLTGVSLVVVASDDEMLQARVSLAAQQRCLPVNVVDRPRLSSFIMPAIVDRSPITIAISTGGAAPALARRLRAEIERAMPAAIGRLARFAEVFREQVRRTLDQPRARRRFWDRVFEGRIGELALAGDEIGARRELIRLLDGTRRETAPAAGPIPGILPPCGAGPRPCRDLMPTGHPGRRRRTAPGPNASPVR